MMFTLELELHGNPRARYTLTPLLFGRAHLGRHGRVFGLYDEWWEFPSLRAGLDALVQLAEYGVEPALDWDRHGSPEGIERRHAE
jgi:hypothetical protein